METKFRNLRKMAIYLSQRLGRKITPEEFEDCVDYIKGFLEAIYNDEAYSHARESASLELEIDDEFIEVWVDYDNIIEGDKEIVIIDFDYNYESFEDTLLNH